MVDLYCAPTPGIADMVPLAAEEVALSAVIARSAATKQSIFAARKVWIASRCSQ
jgi:hypothetical protein